MRNFGAERGQFVTQADEETAARVCVIGQTVARELFGDQDPLDREISLNQVPFRVKGVLVSRGSSPAEGDRDARVIIPISTFRERLVRRVHLDQIVIRVADPEPAKIRELEGSIQAVLREQHRLAQGEADDFSVRTPEFIAGQARLISREVFLLLLGLAAVSGLVAALVIALVMGQSVRARRSEIGIRRALGALPGDILQQIWGEGLGVSLIGGLIGTALGAGGAWGLAEWRQLAFAIDPLVAAVPPALIAFISLAGLIPARSAAALEPTEALRP